MIDFSNIGKYRENNRIEAKKALGGLPESIWETYSSFANTLGGIILLGVEEYPDHSLHVIDLPDPEGMISRFWTLVNDRRKTSACILSREDVFIREIAGNHIVCITVPRARRYDLPVFINGHIEESYRRSGEGDYRCSADEIRSMLRDAERKTRDMHLIEEAGMDGLCRETLEKYRRRLAKARPHGREASLPEEDLLLELHAAGIGKDDLLHPTDAGLLMFFRPEAIRQRFPSFRIMCGRGAAAEWQGNLFDFCTLMEDQAASSGLPAGQRQAFCEAVLNSIVNADYEGSVSLSVQYDEREIRISNPGSFRIGVERALAGGISDPRNGAAFRMFNLIGAGNRRGSGVPGIFAAWRNAGCRDPEIVQSFSPDSITVILPLEKAESPADQGTRSHAFFAARQAFVIQYLTDHIEAKASELAAVLHADDSEIQKILHQLKRRNIIRVDDSLDPVCRLMD